MKKLQLPKLKFNVRIFWSSTMILLLLLAIFLKFCLTGYSFLALTLLGIALIIGAYLLLSIKQTALTSVLKKILTSVVILGFLLIVIAEIPVLSNMKKQEKAESDYVIVLGAGVHGTRPSRILNQRITAAYNFLSTYPETKAILSGGQGKGENISEALCMKNELIKKGIDESRLIIEDRSTSTEENLEFSKKILNELSPNTTKVTIISSDTHLYRASVIARDIGFEPKVYYAYTDFHFLRLSNALREAVAVWVEWIFK